MQGIKHYLIDEVEPTQRFSVAEYKKRAEQDFILQVKVFINYLTKKKGKQ